MQGLRAGQIEVCRAVVVADEQKSQTTARRCSRVSRKVMGKKHRGGSTGEKKAKKRATRARTTYGDEPIFSCNLKRVKRDEKLQLAMEEAKKEEAKLKQYSKQYGSDVDSSDAEVAEALMLTPILIPLSLSTAFTLLSRSLAL